MNPTARGNRGAGTRGAREQEKYMERVSGPIVDRIDLHVEVRAVPFERLAAAPVGEGTAELRARVMAARAVQRARQGTVLNAHVRGKALDAVAELDAAGRTLLGEAIGQQLVIENRPGAGGNIGADAVAKAPADGYTLLMSSGGTISSAGWDFANVGGATQENDYFFDNPFQTPIELTISLNWFAGTSFDNSSGLGQDLHFSDLNLEVWQVLNGQFQTLLAESDSIYNNAEFLRVALGSGSYGIRVTFNGLVYETNSDSFSGEDYGLAWTTTATPEPSAPLMLVLIAGIYLVWRTRRVKARRFSRSGN
jgi:hypothetical protein